MALHITGILMKLLSIYNMNGDVWKLSLYSFSQANGNRPTWKWNCINGSWICTGI